LERYSSPVVADANGKNQPVDKQIVVSPHTEGHRINLFKERVR